VDETIVRTDGPIPLCGSAGPAAVHRMGRIAAAVLRHRVHRRRLHRPNLGPHQRRSRPETGGAVERRDSRPAAGGNRDPIMIELTDVTKRYGTKLAVDRLTLRIEAGELFAFLGPNGAGKTTTIKMLAGLLFPTQGTIRVGGYDLETQGDRARQLMAFVPDTPFLYEKLTGREFLQFIADMYAMTREHGRRRIDAMIELFSLGTFVDDLTERYSHGMRQRTVFAGALLHEPKVLIVDD